jgi:polar amino acid transport system permease protein
MSTLLTVQHWIPALLHGVKFTLLLTLYGTVLGLVIALPLSMIRASKASFIARFLAGAYVEIIRGTPLLLQLFFVYFVLPTIGLHLSPLVAGAISLGVNYSAYLSEVFRAGISAVDHSQWEAAETLGMSRALTWWRVILPQAARIALPGTGNYVVAMFKDTALTATISVTDLLFTGQIIAQETFDYVRIYTVVFFIYFIISYPASVGLRELERRLRTNVA